MLVCLPSLRQQTLIYHNMANAYIESESLPLTHVIGGRIDLVKLIEELDQMYPDNCPDHEMTAWEAGRMSGCIEIIRHLKTKLL